MQRFYINLEQVQLKYKTLQCIVSKWQIPENNNNVYEVGVSFFLSPSPFIPIFFISPRLSFCGIESIGTFDGGVGSMINHDLFIVC